MKFIDRSVLCGIACTALIGCSEFHSNLGKLTCEQHSDVAVSLNNWAAKSFEETYGKIKDADGALVQMFLIDQKVSSPYAASFNRSQRTAEDNLRFAKKKGCDTAGYPLPPVDEFRKRMDVLVKNQQQGRAAVSGQVQSIK